MYYLLYLRDSNHGDGEHNTVADIIVYRNYFVASSYSDISCCIKRGDFLRAF